MTAFCNAIKMLVGFVSLTGALYANASIIEKKENATYCVVPFKARKSVVDIEKLKDCFEKDVKVTSVVVFGNTSPTRIKPNSKLSAQRAEAAARVVREIYPEALVGARGCGVLPGPDAKRVLLIIGTARTVYEIAAEKRKGCKYLARTLDEIPSEPPPPVVEVKKTEKIVWVPDRKALGVWLGAVALFPSAPLSNYPGKQIFGFQIGVRRKLIELTPKLYFYPVLAAEHASIDRSSSEAGIDFSGSANRAAFSISSLYLMGGLHYLLNDTFSFFGELGGMYSQRDLSVSTSNSIPISNHLTTEFGGVIQVGSHINFMQNETMDLFVRPSLGVSQAFPSPKPVRRNFSNTETVDMGALIFSAGLSVGIMF